MNSMPGASLEPQPLAEHPSCNVCGSCERVLLHAPKRAGVPVCETFSASKGVLAAQRIVRCARCGLVYVCPRLPSDQILDAYARSADALYVSQADARTRTFRRAMRLVRRHAPVPGKILDIGAAAGFFCAAARECGWDATGVEPSRWLAEWGGGITGLTTGWKLAEAGFDVTLVEKEAAAGGQARALKHDGFLLDLGAHKFHTVMSHIEALVLELLEGDLLRREKRASILYGKSLFPLVSEVRLPDAGGPPG